VRCFGIMTLRMSSKP